VDYQFNTVASFPNNLENEAPIRHYRNKKAFERPNSVFATEPEVVVTQVSPGYSGEWPCNPERSDCRKHNRNGPIPLPRGPWDEIFEVDFSQTSR
jgi:hypothetical protein